MKCYTDENEASEAEFELGEEECRQMLGDFEAPSNWCQGKYDGWSCWNHTAPDTMARGQCPGSDTILASKYCDENGTWWRNQHNAEWANYTGCYGDDSSEMQNESLLHSIWYVGYGLSAVLCTVAFVVLHICRSPDCGRTKVHQHLFVSFVASCISQAAWLHTHTDIDVLIKNPLWCRALHVFANYSLLSNFAWMFCEGFYLYCLLYMKSPRERLLLTTVIIVGWGFPMVPVIIYVTVRTTCIQHHSQLQNCWMQFIPDLWWCYAFFGLLCQILNVLFLIIILRLVYAKSAAPCDDYGGKSNSSIKRMLATIRALVVLVPLFGVQYLLSCFYRPTGTDVSSTYEIIYALITSTQGSAVAVIFCFTNSEVKNKITQRVTRLSEYGGIVRSRANDSVDLRNPPSIRLNKAFSDEAASFTLLTADHNRLLATHYDYESGRRNSQPEPP